MMLRAGQLPRLDIARLARAFRARRRRSSRHALADQWLIWGARPQAASQLLSERAAELTSPKMRRDLARLAPRVIAEQRDPRCRAYAANRPAIRAELGLLSAVADRLDSTEPVSPRGVALAASPLRDGAGPLYDPQRADELGPTLTDVLRELDQAIESEPSG